MVHFKKLKKYRKKAKAFFTDTESHDKMTYEVALELIHTKETRTLLLPYLTTLGGENEMAFLKIVATLLIYEDEAVAKIADKTLKDNAPFVYMYVNALKEIINKKG